MGFAFATLHWTPDTFWNSTLRELMAAYAYTIPADAINTWSPFSREERDVLDEMHAKAAQNRKLANGE